MKEESVEVLEAQYEMEENNIKVSKQKIKEIENKKRDLIYNLKEIMLNNKNHIDNLFYNKLNIEKEEEYKKLLKKIKDLKKDKILHESYIENLNKQRNKLCELRLKIINLRKTEDEKKIEDDREQILKENIEFLKNNGMIEEGIKKLENIRDRKAFNE